MKKADFSNAESVSLSNDDLFVLSVIYRSRMRTFFLVFVTIFLFAFLRVIRLIFSDDAMLVCASVFCLLAFVIIPAIIVFVKCVDVYRQDMQAGFKLKVDEEVIDKRYFPSTHQYFLSLNNADYLHHEVEASVYDLMNIGESYPVYFAARSHYPFTLRSRFTMM